MWAPPRIRQRVVSDVQRTSHGRSRVSPFDFGGSAHRSPPPWSNWPRGYAASRKMSWRTSSTATWTPPGSASGRVLPGCAGPVCAYEDSATGLETLGLGDEITLAFTCGEFHGFVGFWAGNVAAFRGTSNIGNCLTDAQTPLVSRPVLPGPRPRRVRRCGRRGLAGDPGSARATLFDEPLWVTGHSLGGAMATLASLRLASQGTRFGPFTPTAHRAPATGLPRKPTAWPTTGWSTTTIWCRTFPFAGATNTLASSSSWTRGEPEGRGKIWRKRKPYGRRAKQVQRAHRGVGIGNEEWSISTGSPISMISTVTSTPFARSYRKCLA